MDENDSALRAGEVLLDTGLAPRLGIVLGSGLRALADDLVGRRCVEYARLDGFPRPAVEGHGGQASLGTLGGLPVAILEGRSHFYERGDPAAMRVPIRALRHAGCETVLLTCAAGSLHQDMPCGSLMAIEDHLALAGRNPLVGDPAGPQFVDMGNAYDASLRARLSALAAGAGIGLSSGVYAWFAGPSFETPAEIRAARVLGADAVGMSVAPETILARACGLRVAAVAVITNLAAGLGAGTLTHEETLSAARDAHDDLRRLLAAFCAELAAAEK